MSPNLNQWGCIHIQLHVFSIQPDHTNTIVSFTKLFPPHPRCWGTSRLSCWFSVIASRFTIFARPSQHTLLFLFFSWLAKLLKHSTCFRHKYSTKRSFNLYESIDCCVKFIISLPDYCSALTHLYEGGAVQKPILAETVSSGIQHTGQYTQFQYLNTAAALCYVTIVVTLSKLKLCIILI